MSWKRTSSIRLVWFETSGGGERDEAAPFSARLVDFGGGRILLVALLGFTISFDF